MTYIVSSGTYHTIFKLSLENSFSNFYAVYPFNRYNRSIQIF